MNTKFLILWMILNIPAYSHMIEVAVNNSLRDRKEHSLPDHKITQDIIQALLDLPDWQWVYHAGNEQRLPVKLLKNTITSSNLKLIKFGQPVIILSMEQLKKSNIKAYVHITKLDIAHDTAYFSMDYLYEGAFAEGTLIKKKEKWVAGDYSVFEH